FSQDQATPNVTIIGKISFSSAGSVGLANLRFQTNSDNAVAVTGSAASIVNFMNCYFNCTNTTGISFTTSNASASISITDCSGDIGTTGISLFSHSSTGTLSITFSSINNSGSSTTASTASAGTVNLSYSAFLIPITTSSTAVIAINDCGFTATNTTVLTIGGNTTSQLNYSTLSSGSASALSVGTTSTVNATFLVIDSTNTNAITGAGTLNYGDITFRNTGSDVNTTVAVALTGISQTWTPNLQINGSSTGITYTTQLGGFAQLGPIVSIWGRIVLSSKGVSVGTVTISNLPVTSGANGARQVIPVPFFNQATFAGYSSMCLQLSASSTVATFFISGSGVSVGGLNDTAITNTFSVDFTGVYIIN